MQPGDPQTRYNRSKVAHCLHVEVHTKASPDTYVSSSLLHEDVYPSGRQESRCLEVLRPTENLSISKHDTFTTRPHHKTTSAEMGKRPPKNLASNFPH